MVCGGDTSGIVGATGAAGAGSAATISPYSFTVVWGGTTSGTVGIDGATGAGSAAIICPNSSTVVCGGATTSGTLGVKDGNSVLTMSGVGTPVAMASLTKTSPVEFETTCIPASALNGLLIELP